jgi:hypothetical protein
VITSAMPRHKSWDPRGSEEIVVKMNTRSPAENFTWVNDERISYFGLCKTKCLHRLHF